MNKLCVKSYNYHAYLFNVRSSDLFILFCPVGRIWGSFILVSSCKMSHSVPAVRKVLSNSFDDITTYKDNTFQVSMKTCIIVQAM